MGISSEYLNAVRERVSRSHPEGKTDPNCTCAPCDRFTLLEEVERNKAWENEIRASRYYNPPPVKDTVGARLASAAFEFSNAESFFACPCCEDSAWYAYGAAMGHAFRAAELAYDAGTRTS